MSWQRIIVSFILPGVYALAGPAFVGATIAAMVVFDENSGGGNSGLQIPRVEEGSREVSAGSKSKQIEEQKDAVQNQTVGEMQRIAQKAWNKSTEKEVGPRDVWRAGVLDKDW